MVCQVQNDYRLGVISARRCFDLGAGDLPVVGGAHHEYGDFDAPVIGQTETQFKTGEGAIRLNSPPAVIHYIVRAASRKE